MTQQIRRGVAAAAGVAAGFAATATQAQVVYKPTQDAVTEKQLLQKLDQVTGRVSIPDARAGVLIQPQGRTFREAQTEWMPTIAAVAIFGMLAIVVAFYLLKGRIRLRHGFSGLTIVRFGGIERFAHWLTASSFLILAFTGLNTAFGRSLLLPLMSERAFASMTETLKVVHNYTGFAFIAGVVLVTVLWIKDNFLSRADIEWIKEFGGLFNGKHVPADKFNFGQKVMFWSVVLLGGALAVTGLQLLFPFRWMAIDGMQWALAIHALFGVLFFASIIAHIYIGTLGMEGAFDAMGSGRVDVNWAKEHHALWAEDALKTQTPEPDPAARPMPAE
jgi:formate dehydrogenase subunit gamma